jgi:hypothetical protein
MLLGDMLLERAIFRWVVFGNRRAQQVVCTLNALGLKTEIGESLDEPAAMDPPAGLSFDIDAVLERTRPKEVVNAVGRGPLQTTLARRGSDRTVAGARAPKKRK